MITVSICGVMSLVALQNKDDIIPFHLQLQPRGILYWLYVAVPATSPWPLLQTGGQGCSAAAAALTELIMPPCLVDR